MDIHEARKRSGHGGHVPAASPSTAMPGTGIRVTIAAADHKARRERALFRQFCAIAGLRLEGHSVESRNPPEPDILSQVVGYGTIAFELVEVLDRDLAMTHGVRNRVVEELRRAYLELPPPERRSMSSRLSHALVYVDLAPNARRPLSARSLKWVLGQLSQVRRSFEGDLPTAGMDGAFRRVSISRGGFSGPCFDCSDITFISEPVWDTIAAKFAKRYRTGHPIELVAYYELQPMIAPDRWLPVVARRVRGGLRASPFRRLWIVDLRSSKIVFVHPPRARG